MPRSNESNHDVPLKALPDLPIDAFETDLLLLLRHFTLSLSGKSRDGWQVAYAWSADRWGAPIGLAIAHEVSKLVSALEETRGTFPHVLDPDFTDTDLVVTKDEEQFLLVIHHMRREHTNAARDAVWTLTQGKSLASFIRQAHSFAAKHSLVAPQNAGHVPALRVV